MTKNEQHIRQHIKYVSAHIVTCLTFQSALYNVKLKQGAI